MNFTRRSAVLRKEHSDGRVEFNATLEVECTDCGQVFAFDGLPLDFCGTKEGFTVRTVARLPILPCKFKG
jgi:hypothetical protein